MRITYILKALFIYEVNFEKKIQYFPIEKCRSLVLSIKIMTVAICPAAVQGLEWTKCPAVRNFHRISTERFFKLS